MLLRVGSLAEMVLIVLPLVYRASEVATGDLAEQSDQTTLT